MQPSSRAWGSAVTWHQGSLLPQGWLNVTKHATGCEARLGGTFCSRRCICSGCSASRQPSAGAGGSHAPTAEVVFDSAQSAAQTAGMILETVSFARRTIHSDLI